MRHRSPTPVLALAAVPWILAAACQGPADGRSGGPRRALPPFLLGGIQVNEPDRDAWLDGLAREGMDTVEITTYAKQGDWDSDHLWWEADRAILDEARAAKARGLKVVLILRVALDHAFERNRHLWHGMIQPKDEALLASWFRQYGDWVAGWAEEAEKVGVDLLVVGSELSALTSTLPVDEVPGLERYYLDPEKEAERRAEILSHADAIEERDLWMPGRQEGAPLGAYLDDRLEVERAWAAQTSGDDAAAVARINRRRALLDEGWRALIARVRAVYRGPLGYAANFDAYDQVGFWDALDVFGVNAYFELRETLEPSLGDPGFEELLVDGWRRALEKIVAFRESRSLQSMPLVFTEIGYTWRRQSTVRPWADAGFSLLERAEGPPQLVVWRDQPPAPEERALAMRALARAHRELQAAHGGPFVRGLLYWKLSTLPAHRDVESFVAVLGSGDPVFAEMRALRDGAAASLPQSPP